MTGRELIIYILENNLEDTKLLGLLTVEEAAVKYGVGPATVKGWYEIGLVKGIKVGDKLFIL